MRVETEVFIKKAEQLFQVENVNITEFENLIMEWEHLIATRCYEKNNYKQTYLNLNRLKITVQWFKEHCCLNNNYLQRFLKYLIKHTRVQLNSLTIKPRLPKEASDMNGTRSNELYWTASKRSLIELICALNEAKCINEGNITLQKTVVHFEELFNINLDNYHS